MKIYEDVLPPKLLEKCIGELKSTTGSPVWDDSNLLWTEDLKVGLVGNVSMRILPDETALEVNKALKKYFSKIDSDCEVVYQYYIWNKMAGISNHNDGHTNLAATLYLNDIWDPNWGGLFVWKDKNEKKEYKLNAICPKQNMLIINDEKEMHLVTPTAPTIPYIRITIQIWYGHPNASKI